MASACCDASHAAACIQILKFCRISVDGQTDKNASAAAQRSAAQQATS